MYLILMNLNKMEDREPSDSFNFQFICQTFASQRNKISIEIYLTGKVKPTMSSVLNFIQIPQNRMDS